MNDHHRQPNELLGDFHFERLVSIAAGSLVHLRFELTGSQDLKALASCLSRLPDVRRSWPLGDELIPTGYQFLGEGFLATLGSRGWPSLAVDLLVETSSGRPPRLGDAVELWDYLTGTAETIDAGEMPPKPVDERRRNETETPEGEPWSVSVGPLQVERAGASVIVSIGVPNSEAAVSKLNGDETAELYDVLGTFAIRAIRYADAVEERRTQPPELWQYISPDEMQAKSSLVGHRVGDHLRISQTGDAVQIEIYGGIGDDDLRARVVLTGDEAYALSEPLLSISVQASRAARAADLDRGSLPPSQ